MKINRRVLISLSVILLVFRSPVIIITTLGYLFSSKELLVKFIYRLLPFVIFVLYLILFSLYSGNSYQDSLGQSRDILLCFFIFCFFSVCYSKERNRLYIYNLLKYSFCAVGIFKVFILLYSKFTGISGSDIVNQIRDVWGIKMMLFDLDDSFFFRLQIPLDCAVPPFMFIFIKEMTLSKNKWNALVLFFILVSMLTTMSRAFWFFTFLFSVSSIIIYLNTKMLIKLLCITLVCSAIALSFSYVRQSITILVESRVGSESSKTNSGSDIARQWQDENLTKQFLNKPILGNGLGFSIVDPSRPRADEAYLYERQTLSILMDLGIVHSAILLFLILYNILYTPSENTKGNFIIKISVFFLWIVSGSFNPFLFGASGGVILFIASDLCGIKFNKEYKYDFK